MRRKARKANLVRAAVPGLARGLVATVAMSVPMLVAGRRGVMGTQPPKRIAGRAAEAVDADPADADPVGEAKLNLASTLAHIGFGGSMGALFAVLRARLRLPGPALAQGMAYGLAVWASSYKGWVPAIGAMPPAEQDRPGQRRTILAAHLLYGGVLGLLDGRARPRNR